MEYKVSFYYLEKSLILTSTASDLFYCLIVCEIGVNNSFTWLKRSVYFLSQEYELKTRFFLKKQFFDFLIYPWWISVITGNDFMGNAIRNYILKGLSK